MVTSARFAQCNPETRMCISLVDHLHSPARIPMDLRGLSTKLIHYPLIIPRMGAGKVRGGTVGPRYRPCWPPCRAGPNSGY